MGQPVWAKRSLAHCGTFFFFIVVLLLFAACEKWRAQKAAWRQPEAASRPGSVEVAVEPREGITVLLDGEPVAHASPWQNANVPAGPHVLEVRAMGHFSVSLPVSIDANHPLRLPVRLRPRAPLPFGPPGPAVAAAAPPTGRPAPSSAGPAGARPSARGALASAGPARRALPGNTRPLRLTVAARPAAAILVDGTAADADDVRITQADGQLRIGPMKLAYRVRAGRRLEFVIPNETDDADGPDQPNAEGGPGGSSEGASASNLPSEGSASRAPVLWYVGPTQVKAKSAVRLGAVPVTLRRAQLQQTQKAVLQRVD